MGFRLSSSFRTAISLSCFLHLAFFIGFLCSTWKSRFFVPTRSIAKPARAGAVKVGRHTNLSTSFGLDRPCLDSSEHGGTFDTVGMTIRGEPALSGAQINRATTLYSVGPGPEP
jgi:hypothetical protein